MTSVLSDNEFDSLLSDSELDLGQVDATTATEAPTATALPQLDMNFFGKIPVTVTLEVASTEISLQDLMEVDAATVIALDKVAGAPLDVKVNGALFAKAEVVVMNGNYGLRIVELSHTGQSGLV